MKFKLDENLPASLVDTFEASGHDAVSTTSQGLQGEEDPTIADVCRREGRALVTLDTGFADIRAYPPADHPGIVVLRLRHQAISHISAMVIRVLRLLAERPLEQTLWIVDEEKVRFRS